MFSLIIPIYRNEGHLDCLLEDVVTLSARSSDDLEIVFVIDGSPDRCYQILRSRLPELPLRSQLLLLSRNFGSFAAITAGLEAARGDFFAVLAADLQEPPELAMEFFRILESDEADIVFGTRQNRADPFFTELASNAFWGVYRRLVLRDMPPGGVDVFGCNRIVRDRLLEFHENNTSLIALLLWIGYRRAFVPYERRPRKEGKSGWTFGKKLRYSVNSIFNFTDLPIRLLLYSGSLSLLLACIGTVIVLVSRFQGYVHVPGYTPIIVAILFFGAITSLGLGIVGQYLWLTLQNTRARPNYIVSHGQEYKPGTEFHSAKSAPTHQK